MAMAMTLAPINSTLNRVMIKEFGLPATLVALLASLPDLFSPLQVAIGSFSDRHPVLGLRRTPYIVLGLFLCVAGVMLAPQAAFLLAENFWAGLALAALVFGAWGMADALARGWGAVMSGAVRDLFSQATRNPLLGYVAVFGLEASMLVLSLVLLRRIDVGAFHRQAEALSLAERMAISNE
jgi:BCD family chlorophyll transporter-like MFS transporter